MKQGKWRLISTLLIFMLCFQLLDPNMFMHVKAIHEPVTSGNTIDISELPIVNGKKHISLDYSDGAKWKAFVLRYDDVKGCDEYKDYGGDYSNSIANENNPFVLDIIDNYGNELQTNNINKIRYNIIRKVKNPSEDNLYGDIWRTVMRDFTLGEPKKEKENWVAVCFAFLELTEGSNEYYKRYDIHVYPVFVHCKVKYGEIKDLSCILTATEKLRAEDSSYSVGIVPGVSVDGYMGEEKKEEFAFTERNEGQISFAIKEKGIEGNERIKANLSVPYEEFRASSSFVNAVKNDIENATYITKPDENGVALQVNIKGIAERIQPLAKKLKAMQKAKGKQLKAMKASEVKSSEDITGTIEPSETATADATLEPTVQPTPTESIVTSPSIEPEPVDKVVCKSAVLSWQENGEEINLLESLTEEDLEQIDRVLISTEKVQTLTLTFPVKDGIYKKEDAKLTVTYSVEGTDENHSVAVLSNQRVVVDTQSPVVEWGEWTWNKDEEANSYYFENKITIIDDNIPKENIPMYWHMERDDENQQQLIITDEPDKDAIGFEMKYNPEEKTYAVRLDCDTYQYGESILEGKTPRILVKDLAGNVSTTSEESKIKNDKPDICITIDGEGVDSDKKYFIADTHRMVNGQQQSASVKRYEASVKEGEVVAKTSNTNLIQSATEGNHKATYTVFYNEFDKEKSYFQMEFAKADGTEWDKQINFNDANVTTVSQDNFGRIGYTFHFGEEIREYGTYTFTVHIESDGKVIEEKKVTALYDMTPPDMQIKVGDRTEIVYPGWDWLHLFGNETTYTTYDVTFEDKDTGIDVYGAYVTKDNQKSWQKAEMNATGEYKINVKMEVDYKKEGSLYFNAYSHYGYMTSENPIFEIVDDNTAPEVHIVRGSFYDKDKELKNDEVLDGNEQITVGIIEKNFKAEACHTYLLTDEQYKEFKKAEDKSIIGNYLVDKEWTMQSGVYTMNVSLDALLDGAKMVLLVQGKDMANNPIEKDNIVSFIVDTKNPELSFVKPDVTSNEMLYQGRVSYTKENGQDWYTGRDMVYRRVNRVDLYKTLENSKDGYAFQFKLEDKNLAKIQEDVSYETIVGAKINILAVKSELSAMGWNDSWGEYYSRYLYTEINRTGNDLENTPFSLTVKEPVVDEARGMLVSCTVELTVEEGYYENFRLSVVDETSKSDVLDEYYDSNYNCKNSSTINDAFCVDSGMKVTQENLDITCENANKKNKHEGQKFTVTLNIPNVNIQFAQMQVYKGQEDVNKNIVTTGEPILRYKVKKSEDANQSVWVLDGTCKIEGNDYYVVKLNYSDFTGESTEPVETVLRTDNTPPSVKITPVTVNADGVVTEVENCTTEDYPKDYYAGRNRTYNFMVGGEGLKLKITASDLALSQAQMEKSLIEICKLPNTMSNYNDSDFGNLKWYNIDTCILTEDGVLDSTTSQTVKPLVNVMGCKQETCTKEKEEHTVRQNWIAEGTWEDGRIAFSEVIEIKKSGRYLIKVTCSDENKVTHDFTRDKDGAEILDGIVIDSEAPNAAKATYHENGKNNVQSSECSNVSVPSDMTKSKKQIRTSTYYEVGQLSQTNDKTYQTFANAEDAINHAKGNKNIYFATNSVQIGLKAYDNLCDQFTVEGELRWEYDNYKKTSQTKKLTFEKGENEYYNTTINENFRGILLISITDLVGNKSYIAEGTLFVDLIEPNIAVISSAEVGKGQEVEFFQDRTFTITVSDNNCSKHQLSLEGLDGNTLQNVSVKPSIRENDLATSQVSTYKIKLTDNKTYKFSIVYKDEYVQYKVTVSKFGIDSKVPVLTNQFTNTDRHNGKYFNQNQTAILTVNEANPVDKSKIATIKKNRTAFKEYYLDKKKVNNDEYKVRINFTEDGYYSYVASAKDMAGNKSTDNISKHFVVDKNAPVISKNDVTYEVKNSGKVQKAIHKLSFGLFFNESIVVTVKATDATSGIQKIIYYTQDEKTGKSKEITVSGKQLSSAKLGTESTMTTSFTVSPNFKGNIYVKAVDFADNVSHEGRFLKCNFIVLKQKGSSQQLKQSLSIKALQEPNENGFYNRNFSLSLSAKEEYDGIQRVSYQAGSSKLVTKDFTKESKMTTNWSDTYRVIAKNNDDNDVKVILYYYDNAGNPRVKATKSFKVDVTKPVLSVTYDNNHPASQKYYKTNRTATIRIDELNFDAKDVIVKIIRNGRVVNNMIPGKSAWSTHGITHTAQITFAEDGEYEFSVQYKDLADNKADYVHQDKFTVDKTEPKIAVSYDNTRSAGKQFYNKARTATITLDEHNFNPSNVKVNVSRKDTSGSGVPHISGWSTSGDKHTATVKFASDGIYSIGVTASDEAGNQAKEWKTETFTIDQTKPELKITGVKNSNAYNGKVVPVITYVDTNLDASTISVLVEGYKRGKVQAKYKESTTRNGKVRTLDTFPQKKSVDDVYTMTVKAADKAGNSVTKKILFSINRFGSNYKVEDSTTASVLNSYTKDEKDIKIEEVNVRNLKNYAVTCSKDGKITTLEEGKDYKVEVSESSYKWRKYTYTVFSKNFTMEGNYSLCVASTDAAGNVSNNEEKKQDLRFTVDKTAPTLTTAGIENNRIYNAATGVLDMIVNDNIMVDQVKLYLNKKELQTWERDEIKDALGEIQRNVPGSNSRQDITIAIKDIAGNETQYEISNFLITQNKWIQFYNNKKAVVGTIGGAGITLAAVCMVLLARGRKSKKVAGE